MSAQETWTRLRQRARARAALALRNASARLAVSILPTPGDAPSSPAPFASAAPASAPVPTAAPSPPFPPSASAPVRRMPVVRTPARVAPFREIVAQRFDSIVNALSGLGGQYDKGTTGRPDTSRTPLDFNELTALYRYNPYAQRFVNIVPDDATRKGWRVTDDSPDVDVMQPETTRLEVGPRVRDAMAWGRLYGGACIFIVVDEAVPPEYAQRPQDILAQPLNLATVRRVLNLVVLDANGARPNTYDPDPRSPGFGDPLTWWITPPTNAGIGIASAVVHRSRILYFPGRRLPPSLRMGNMGIDDSVIEGVWDSVRNKTSIDQAGALLAQEIKINVLKIQDIEQLSLADQADAFDMKMKIIAKSKSLNNMVMIGATEEFQTIATPISGYVELNDAAKESLCCATEVPDTILFGNAPSGLNADGASHRMLWANVIASVQENRIKPLLTRLYRIIYRSTEGPTLGVEPETWDVVFNPLDELTEQEQAILEKTHAEADAMRVQAGILPADHIAESRYSEAGYRNEIQPYDPNAFDEAAVAAAEAALAAGTDRPLTGANELPATSPAMGTDAAATPMTDEAVATLAAKMTQYGIGRCRHKRVNACDICGIERVEDFVLGPDGSPVIGPDGEAVWRVIWRPIYSVVAAVQPPPAGADVTPAPENGAATA